jgi:hypothetical protein
MSRQVGHFAATSFSSASLNAARDMRRVLHRKNPDWFQVFICPSRD